MVNKDVKIGQKLRIIANTAAHNVPIGEIVISQSNYPVLSLRSGGAFYVVHNNRQVTVYGNDIEEIPQTREELTKEIEGLESKIKDIKNRLAFLDEVEEEEFDETHYKCWKALEIAGNTKKAKWERAKAISDLIMNSNS